MPEEEEREKLAKVIRQWNTNRLDLFEISQPDEVRRLQTSHLINSGLRNTFSIFSIKLKQLSTRLPSAFNCCVVDDVVCDLSQRISHFSSPALFLLVYQFN